MENIITLLWIGLGFKIADRIHVDQLNDCVYREWLKIPLQNRQDQALLVVDIGDENYKFCGTQVDEFKLQFIPDMELNVVAAAADQDEKFYWGPSTRNSLGASRGTLVNYTCQRLYQEICRPLKEIIEPAEVF